MHEDWPVAARPPGGLEVVYNHRARPCHAAEAAAVVRRLDDPRGWEVFVPRGIQAGEIRQIRPAPRSPGWRYFPDAHGTAPCTCEGCAPFGSYGAARLRERRPHEMDGPFEPRNVLLAQLADAAWRAPGVDDLLTRLAADVDVRESAAWVLSERRRTGRAEAQ